MSILLARELARLVGGGTGSRFGMFKLLADESGLKQRKERYCVVAAFVGSVEQWDVFNATWSHALASANVPVFHAMEFWERKYDPEHPERGTYRPPPYSSWAEGEDINFINSLLCAIRGAQLRPLCMAVDIELFFSLTVDERR